MTYVLCVTAVTISYTKFNKYYGLDTETSLSTDISKQENSKEN